MRVGLAAGLVALVLSAACDHAQPFGPADLGANQPSSAAFPRRLTFNPADDRQPAWLPDGSGILYSFGLDRPDHDRCLGLLPAEGGRRTWTACHTPATLDADSTNVLMDPAAGPDGLLAYVRVGSAVDAISPNSTELIVATLADPLPGRVVLSFPYTAPDSVVHTTLADLRWVDAHTLVYVAELAVFGYNPVDTTVVPLSVVRLDLSASPPAVTVLPGTGGATSVAVDTTGAIYYTLPGDSRIYRFRAGAAPDTVYDFGAAGAATGVTIGGGRLAALAGGVLYRVTLASGARSAITTPPLQAVAAPALAPDAARVVVEVRPTGGSAAADLWLLEVP
jgi:hypothetical protein